MENNIELIELYDIYGNLLTTKQRKMFELYYLKDLSLREIAENSKITFQAVRYSLEVSKKTLINFENTIKMHAYKKQISELKEYIKENDLNNKEITKILNRL